MVNYAIRSGFVSSGSDSAHSAYGAKLIKGPFFLLKWLSQALAYLGVSAQDPCCISSTANPPIAISRPIRYNQTTSHMEYQNTSGVWTAIAGF
jgi:hypothetical protein